MSATRARTVRVVRAVALTALLQGPAGGEAEAATGLDGLRLFVTPERRAALDGRSPPAASERTVPRADVDARASAPASARAAAPRAVRPPPTRSDRPPPGSAVLRSARGTSRIVDGVPVPGGLR